MKRNYLETFQAIKKILTSNKAKTFYWTTANGFIGILAIGVTDIDWIYAPMVIALLNGITKYINKEYL